MRKHTQHKPTFRQIVAEAAPQNFQRLMDKARLFSRLAKAMNEQDRRLAYLYKNRCLKRLIDVCP